MDRVRDARERDRLLLKVHEAAAMLGIGRTKAYELIGRGELQVVHIDGAARAPRQRSASQPPLPFIDRSHPDSHT